MKIAIGCDHAGFNLKKDIEPLLKELNHTVDDYGAHSPDAVDYVDYAQKVSEAVCHMEAERGILICGTGIGMSIVANKFSGIRASLCDNIYTAKMSRLHNDANILILPGRVIGAEIAKEIIKIWLSTPFEGGRHQARLDKVKDLERKLHKQ
jgi:ribose 5-phosphate isomerase B